MIQQPNKMYFQDGLLGEFGAPVGGYGGPDSGYNVPYDLAMERIMGSPMYAGTQMDFNDPRIAGMSIPFEEFGQGVPIGPSGMPSVDMMDPMRPSQASDPNYGQFMRKQQAMNTEAPMMEDAPAPEASGEMSGMQVMNLMKALGGMGGGSEQYDFSSAPGIVRGRPMQSMNFGPSYSQGYTGGLLG